ncbi:MAG: hypothetical protein ABEJ40_11220 [Haloarculaceae archaeon]
MPSRRVLALAAVLLVASLAGCSNAAGSLSMHPIDDDEALAERASRPLPTATDLPYPPASAVALAAVENGSATVVALDPPVRSGSGLPFRHEGKFYNLSQTAVGTEPGYRAGVRIDFNASSVNGSVVAFADLPAVDRQRLSGAFERGPRRRPSGPGYDFGVGVTYTRREADASVLVPEQQYSAVRYRGETYPVAVEGVTETTLTVYRYDATVVANSSGAYAAQLRERYAFDLSKLSDAETSVVEAALNDTYRPDSTDDEGFAALVERFRAREAVAGDGSGGEWLARYRGQLYWVEMDFGAFVRTASGGSPVTPPSVTPH